MKKPEAIDPSKVIIIPRPPVSGTEKSTTKNEAENVAKAEVESTAAAESGVAQTIETKK